MNFAAQRFVPSRDFLHTALQQKIPDYTFVVTEHWRNRFDKKATTTSNHLNLPLLDAFLNIEYPIYQVFEVEAKYERTEPLIFSIYWEVDRSNLRTIFGDSYPEDYQSTLDRASVDFLQDFIEEDCRCHFYKINHITGDRCVASRYLLTKLYELFDIQEEYLSFINKLSYLNPSPFGLREQQPSTDEVKETIERLTIALEEARQLLLRIQ